MAASTIHPTNFTTLFSVGSHGQTQHLTVPLLAGSSFQTTGLGEVPVSMVGARGVLDVTFVTGAAGTARAVAFLADAAGVRYLGIAVDTTNRVYGLASVDGVGTVLAQSYPSGVVPAGTQVTARLVFDSTAAVEGTWYIAISVNGVIRNMVTAVTTAWTAFKPTKLLLGDGASLGTYNGARAPFVQLSEQVGSTSLTTRTVGRSRALMPLSCDFVAGASMTAVLEIDP